MKTIFQSQNDINTDTMRNIWVVKSITCNMYADVSDELIPNINYAQAFDSKETAEDYIKNSKYTSILEAKKYIEDSQDFCSDFEFETDRKEKNLEDNYMRSKGQ